MSALYLRYQLALILYNYVYCFQVDDEAMDLNKDLISKLLELDDVDAVYTDQKWSTLYFIDKTVSYFGKFAAFVDFTNASLDKL